MFEELTGLSFFDCVGLAGVVGYLVAHAGLQVRDGFAGSAAYAFLNVGSAILVIISLLNNFNLAAMIGQAAWMMLSIYGYCRHAYGGMRRAEHASAPSLRDEPHMPVA
ncbi:MAG: cyclic nucleotide-binding protein [Alphaproteobacteria bacterium]|nr:cyclic nucleotide-binding protein [Alphaproteobacteria bacterium]